MTRSWLVVPLLLLVACARPQTTDPAPDGSVAQTHPFWLPAGESHRVEPDGPTITFRRVAAESRCPTGAECVWEGRAEIDLRVESRDGAAAGVVAPIAGFVTRRDTLAHQSVEAVGFRITLMQLDPYPVHDSGQPDPSNYRALLKVGPAER